MYVQAGNLLVATFLSCCLTRVLCSTKAKNLYEATMHKSGYNRFVRPVNNESDQLTVDISLTLGQIIDVDEKNQVMTTNVWVQQQWHDENLKWDPSEHGNVTSLSIPAHYIWHPDIVLYNTADGKYEMTADTKTTVHYDGTVRWEPPANFKSSCNIDVTYFPFDQQNCTLEFGSWTYNLKEVEINHRYNINQSSYIEEGIDLRVFYTSVEWEVMAAPAMKKIIHYAGSEEEYRKWTFKIVLKRRFLFYTINLIIPLFFHSFITILVFYLPADSKQKITLCISVLFSLIVFFLMLAEIIPPSSIVVPLLGKYLVVTMMLVVISIIITVVTYNVHFRTTATHTMSDWMKKVFLYWMPRILRMQRPKIENSHDIELKHIKLRFCSCVGNDEEDQMQWLRGKLARKMAGKQGKNQRMYQFGSKRTRTQTELIKLSHELDESALIRSPVHSDEVQDAIDGALFIVNHLKQEDEFKRAQEDWKYVALVMDRLLLWIYIVICAVGSIAIFCQAPMLYDKSPPFEIIEAERTDISESGFRAECTKAPEPPVTAKAAASHITLLTGLNRHWDILWLLVFVLTLMKMIV